MGKKVKIGPVPRIEGEAGFIIEYIDGKPEIKLRVSEAPRFFEALLRGRSPQEAIDFTARICGICPVAYQMSAVHAMERIFYITVSEEIKKLRRLFYCGEWIESHCLHIFFLHGPDFYDLPDAWSSKAYLGILKKGIGLKKTGNKLIEVIGGRSIHPVSVRVGGFFKVPEKKALTALLPEIEKAFEESLEIIKWTANLDIYNEDREHEFICLGDAGEYPMNHGSVISSSGLKTNMEGFLNHMTEFQRPYSNALFSGLKEGEVIKPYLVGPLARLNLNYRHLPEDIKSVIKEAGISLPLKNIKSSIIARAIEVSFALYEAMRLIKEYEAPERPFMEYEPISGKAIWITEAPRGMLIHYYEVDEQGLIKEARLIPPTSQNLFHMERELDEFIKGLQKNTLEALKKDAERLIRSYDPCISCSVHVVRF